MTTIEWKDVQNGDVLQFITGQKSLSDHYLIVNKNSVNLNQSINIDACERSYFCNDDPFVQLYIVGKIPL